MASTGQLTAGTINPTSDPPGSITWTDPNNLIATGGSFASATVPQGNQTQITFLSNYGASLPSGSTIDGVQLDIDAIASVGSAGIIQASLANGSSLIGSVKSSSALTTSLATYTLGGPADLWGASLNEALIESSNFGVPVIVGASMAGLSVQVNNHRVTIFYTSPTGEKRTLLLLGVGH